MLPALLLLSVCFLAWSNGANDNFKGVATLLGSGSTSHRSALQWGTVCTLLGSVASIFLAQSLLKAFSGKGLVPDELVGSPEFLMAVASGAGGTVLLATLVGLPISTTHGLVGALVGAGLAASAGAVELSVLLQTYLVPLLISPLLAFALGALLWLMGRRFRLGAGLDEQTRITSGSVQAAGGVHASAVAGSVALPGLLHGVHLLSAGAVSFARGLNDTPKIAALLLAVPALDSALGAGVGLAAVGAAIALGGWFQSRKVAQTMSHGIAEMNQGQGVAANLATALLVLVASRLGVPVSTTHVSVGSLVGIGVAGRTAQLRSVRTILMAWVVTLPCAAAISATVLVLAS